MPGRAQPLSTWAGGPLHDPKRERFVVLVVCDGLPPHVAYLKAGFKATSEASARSNSSRLMGSDIIQYRKRELEEQIANKTVQKRVDYCEAELDEREQAVRDLRRAIEMAFELKKPGDVGELWKKVGTLRGWWVEQTATIATVSELRAIDDNKLIQAIFGAQQISTDQRQSALQVLLDRRRQIEAKPAAEVDEVDS
jgi:hypothetical protein